MDDQVEETNDMFQDYGLNINFTAPSLISEEKIIISFISDQKDMMKFIERGVMVAAYRNGYYDIPKKVSSEELSHQVNISKPTLLEHLRKAERRVLAEIMAGYAEQ